MEDLTPRPPLPPEYDWRISAKKGLFEFLRDFAVLGSGAVAMVMTAPGGAEALLHSRAAWTTVGASLIVAFGRSLANWSKNRDR